MLSDYIRKIAKHEDHMCLYIPKDIAKEEFFKFGDYVRLSIDKQNQSLTVKKVELI